jgi:hypothetical protein
MARVAVMGPSSKSQHSPVDVSEMSNQKRRIVVTKSEQFLERAGVALREVEELDCGAGLGVVVFPANFADAVPYSRREISSAIRASIVPPNVVIQWNNARCTEFVTPYSKCL